MAVGADKRTEGQTDGRTDGRTEGMNEDDSPSNSNGLTHIDKSMD